MSSAFLHSPLAQSPYFGLVPFYGPAASLRHMPILPEDTWNPANNEGLLEMQPISQEIKGLGNALERLKSGLTHQSTLTIAPGTLWRQCERAKHCLNTLLDQVQESHRVSRAEEYTYAACGVTGTLLSVALTVSMLTQVVFAHRALAILAIGTTCLLSLTSIICSGCQLAILYSNHQIRSRLPSEGIDSNLVSRLDAIFNSLRELSSNAQRAVASPLSRRRTPNP